MGRLENYKNIRRYKRRCLRIALLSFFLAVAGILIADYSINGLMTDTGKIKIISFKTFDSQLEVCFMNMKFYTDANYLLKFIDKLCK
ncbi:MAG: hypothetical protein HPY74_11670 [Firmicutes bacterium]|nr:hypothetical protein [Bacillota bacterium]